MEKNFKVSVSPFQFKDRFCYLFARSPVFRLLSTQRSVQTKGKRTRKRKWSKISNRYQRINGKNQRKFSLLRSRALGLNIALGFDKDQKKTSLSSLLSLTVNEP